MQDERDRQLGAYRVAREPSTRHFAEPPGCGHLEPTTIKALARAASPAPSAFGDMWDDLDTQPDAFAHLFDVSDLDEPTVNMRRPTRSTEPGPAHIVLELEEGEQVDADVITSARRIE